MISVESDKKKGEFLYNTYVLMFILLFLWGPFAAVSKLTLGYIDSFQLQFYMFGIAVIIMTVILTFNKKIRRLKALSSKEFLKLLLYAIPSFLYYFFYTLSLKLIPAIEASMLNYLFPIMIVIFAIPLNRERLNLVKLISILLGFIGMIIIITSGKYENIRISNIFGDLLALGAAISWGIFSNLLKKNKVDIMLSNYIILVVSFILSCVSMFLFSKFILPDFTSFTGLFWISFINIILAYYIWTKALKVSSSAIIASLSFITPFVSLVFIMLLTGEKMTVIQFAGLIVIVAGVMIQSLGEWFKNKGLSV